MGPVFSFFAASSFFFSLRLYISLFPQNQNIVSPMFIPSALALVLAGEVMIMVFVELFLNKRHRDGRLIRNPISILLAGLAGFIILFFSFLIALQGNNLLIIILAILIACVGTAVLSVFAHWLLGFFSLDKAYPLIVIFTLSTLFICAFLVPLNIVDPPIESRPTEIMILQATATAIDEAIEALQTQRPLPTQPPQGIEKIIVVLNDPVVDALDGFLTMFTLIGLIASGIFRSFNEANKQGRRGN